ncbi:hypothetical protein AXK56_09200 [Tsukamurella pulmonis]|uniref:Uncharacterized protein n=1 Tax=Tsukamurella pulmonis TaxID=47312 RepID=A0A1H1BMT0_9ACTN|nr:hypothetical protein [Tsukamurella pulmonis]KXO90273.1 hypothetical protein AXK56_09200 [Tsukamurella pulmonis]SDQ53264.1 hypothetical protein SAMN04489765_0771 [Tsukamurella pulmonis]SUP24877.1 Uncharacterised protein [Tsukamurella pulmonis]
MSHGDIEIVPVVRITPVGLIEVEFGDQVMTLDTEAAQSLAVNLLALVIVVREDDPPPGVRSEVVKFALLARVADAVTLWRDELAEPDSAPTP